jgi:hypothetical protein
MQDDAATDGPRREGVSVRCCGKRPVEFLQRLGGLAEVGDEVYERAVESKHRAVTPVADADGSLRDRIEDRLGVGRRARDRANDLAGRRLLLERLR